MFKMILYMGQFIAIFAIMYYILPNIVLRKKLNLSDARGVLLTFDDGPSPGVTEDILNILAENNTNACFFVLGKKAEASKDLMARMVREGHSIGLHGNTHRHPMCLTPAEQWQELSEAYQTLTKLECEPRYYRAPHGFYTLSTWLFCIHKGLDIVHWTALTEDWKAGEVKDLKRRLMRLSAPGKVLVLHDGSEGKADPDALNKMPVALKSYLKDWRAQGGLLTPWSDYEKS